MKPRSFRLLTALVSASALPVVCGSFEPYEMNGGLVSAVAGRNFYVIAADTRMSSGMLLHSRNHIASRLWTVDGEPIMAKVEDSLRSNSGVQQQQQQQLEVRRYPLSDAPVFIGSAGCSTDCRALQNDLRADLRAASHFGQAIISRPHQVATSLSQTLYQRRSFPYYAFCVAAAMDGNARMGKVYVYDAIGSYEQVAVAAAGSGREALQPILDRMFTATEGYPLQVEGTAANAVSKLCKAYRSVSEREIEVGDKLVLHVTEVTAEGDVKCQVLVAPLKED